MAQELAAYSGLTRAVALIQLIIKDAKTPFGCVAMLEQGERKTIKDLTSADEISDYLEKEQVNTVLFYVNLNDKKSGRGSNEDKIYSSICKDHILQIDSEL